MNSFPEHLIPELEDGEVRIMAIAINRIHNPNTPPEEVVNASLYLEYLIDKVKQRIEKNIYEN